MAFSKMLLVVGVVANCAGAIQMYSSDAEINFAIRNARYDPDMAEDAIDEACCIVFGNTEPEPESPEELVLLMTGLNDIRKLYQFGARDRAVQKYTKLLRHGNLSRRGFAKAAEGYCEAMLRLICRLSIRQVHQRFYTIDENTPIRGTTLLEDLMEDTDGESVAGEFVTRVMLPAIMHSNYESYYFDVTGHAPGLLM